MPKKKKTRRGKILTDLRRQPTHTFSQTSSVLSSLKSVEEKEEEPVISHSSPLHMSPILTSDYRYLSRDLFKTALLTGLIIVAEVVVKLLHF
jgi:hypothetical protein